MKTTLYFYDFNLKDPNDKIRYEKLCEERKAQGLKLFDGISANGIAFMYDHIKLYGATWCGPCSQAKLFFKKNNLEYEYIDIDTEEGKERFSHYGIQIGRASCRERVCLYV